MKNNGLNIKEKADFIYLNSGVICSKLIKPDMAEDILNYLQVFLLCDLPISELEEICLVLAKEDVNIVFNDNYNSSIKIMFSICELIDKSDYSLNGKISLKNKIRKYMSYLKYDESILESNNEYVIIKKRN